MITVPSQNDLVLVCLIPKPRDMEIARLLGWYRIPLKHAPKVIYTDCLAFYQPASFGKEHQWKIEYCATVHGVELTKRKELLKEEKFHPRAEDEYFKISLDALAKLERPILADKWKRITFFYTTGEQILNAETISDLIISQEKKELFKNVVMEYRRKFKDINIPTDDMPMLENEFLEYFLELNNTIQNTRMIEDKDFD